MESLVSTAGIGSVNQMLSLKTELNSSLCRTLPEFVQLLQSININKHTALTQ